MTINDLLSADEAVAKNSEVVFSGLGTNATECANAGLRVFEAAYKAVRSWEESHANNEKFNELAGILGLSGQQLWDLVRSSQPDAADAPQVSEARKIDLEVSDALARRMLLQICWRAYRWGMTDLRRLRLTSSAGYMRVAAESIGLLLVFKNEPSLGRRWINPAEDMVKFFKESNPGVKTVLKEQGLTTAYDHGSAVAQHARFASAARGVRLSDGEVLDQEFDPENPVSFHLGLAYFLRVFKRVFLLFPSVFPSFETDESFKERVQEYNSLEEKTWWVLERKYVEEIKDFYAE